MASAVIICCGEFPRKEYPLNLLREADYIICCDNALSPYLRNSVKVFGKLRRPDIVIGDLDSISRRLQKEYADIIIRETEQETNDMSKAFHYAISHFKDLTEIHFLAATGKREDHTVGNMSLLMEFARELNGTSEHKTYEIPESPYSQDNAPVIDIVSDYSRMFAVTDSCSFPVVKGREISIFSPDNSLKIVSDGLEWQTSDVIFDNWWKATLNKSNKDSVYLKFSHRSIALIVLDRS